MWACCCCYYALVGFSSAGFCECRVLALFCSVVMGRGLVTVWFALMFLRHPYDKYKHVHCCTSLVIAYHAVITAPLQAPHGPPVSSPLLTMTYSLNKNTCLRCSHHHTAKPDTVGFGTWAALLGTHTPGCQEQFLASTTLSHK